MCSVCGVTGSDAAAPADCSRGYYTGHSRLVEDLQHVAAHKKNLELPQAKSVLSLHVHSLSVAFPVQSVVKGIGDCVPPPFPPPSFPPEVHNHPLALRHI